MEEITVIIEQKWIYIDFILYL